MPDAHDAGSSLCPPEILAMLRWKLSHPPTNIMEALSAQQRVLILSFPADVRATIDDGTTRWAEALQRGSYKLILRIWMHSRRWWTLKRSTCLADIASSEVAGYQIARQALYISIRIPDILYCSWETTMDAYKYPWAIVEYVGYESTLFAYQMWDDSYTKGMIKVRKEYDFDEPHPRWGRVPVENCLDYALMVLRQVIIPIHRFCNKTEQVFHRTQLCGCEQESNGKSYGNMIEIYKQAFESIAAAERRSRSQHESVDLKMSRVVQILKLAIQKLEAESTHTINLSPVLCHMDCQPQNLLFARAQDGIHKEATKPHVASVLDWEEAAYADPRFELLLLCRKVCANRTQANNIWKIYAEELPQPNLASIIPWLRLETVHSLTTLLLQSVDLGGRSPWESKPDLWGKIERELERLSATGWSFCDLNIFNGA